MWELDELKGLGSYRKDVLRTIEKMAAECILGRIWDGDHTVWKPDPAEITNRLGWLSIAEAMRTEVARLEKLAGPLHDEGYRHALLLGMGGSSLAPQVFRRTFRVREGYLDLAVLDSTDPEAVLSFAEGLDPEKTLYLVATKSGGTVETLSFFKYFFNRVATAVGEGEAGRHFAAITDPGSKLADLAGQHRFRDTFLNNPDIGGRYSALSFFGLVPAALIGVDLPRLLDRATAQSAADRSFEAAAQSRSGRLGAVLGTLANAGRDKLTIVLSEKVASFGDWIEQLIAESTGKEGRGILPVVGEPLGPPQVYGQDRLFVHICLDGDADHDAALAALREAGHPVVRLNIKDLYDLGGQFFLWELATAVAGHLMDINPFDQPDVESAKVVARRMVAAYKKTGHVPREKSLPARAADLEAFLSQAAAGDYITLQAYLHPTPATDAALATLRLRLRDRYRLAATVGYGPRFLHSTGQLHKGDGGRGLFVQFTAEGSQDAPIPDRAGAGESSITFGVLKMAQALGDRRALQDSGRRVVTFHLGEDAVDRLEDLARGV
jgi:glucose-6-phosphate isomerase